MLIETNFKFPNIIVFTHNDMDGLFSGMIIKLLFDNNLQNENFERNVQCYICSYNKSFNIEWFKEKVLESYIDGMKNIVFMTDYAIQPNNMMGEFYKWLQTKNIEFNWIDHHIMAIKNCKQFNILGWQAIDASGCMNTWKFLMGMEEPPEAIKMASDYDTWNKKSEYSWDKQLQPLTYFINSLGIDLNNNTRRIGSNLL